MRDRLSPVPRPPPRSVGRLRPPWQRVAASVAAGRACSVCTGGSRPVRHRRQDVEPDVLGVGQARGAGWTAVHSGCPYGVVESAVRCAIARDHGCPARIKFGRSRGSLRLLRPFRDEGTHGQFLSMSHLMRQFGASCDPGHSGSCDQIERAICHARSAGHQRPAPRTHPDCDRIAHPVRGRTHASTLIPNATTRIGVRPLPACSTFASGLADVVHPTIEAATARSGTSSSWTSKC